MRFVNLTDNNAKITEMYNKQTNQHERNKFVTIKKTISILLLARNLQKHQKILDRNERCSIHQNQM